MMARMMLNPGSASVVAILAMLVLLLMGYLLRVALRTRQLPLCWNCGASKVRRSLAQGPLDVFSTFLFLSPYRCQGCRVRFYGLRSHRQLAERATNGSI